MSMPGRYLEQAQTTAPRGYDQRDALVPPSQRDTVHSRLDAAAGALARCESLAIALGEKLAGQAAETAQGGIDKGPSGVHGLALDLHARAQRLEQILAAVNEVLA